MTNEQDVNEMLRQSNWITKILKRNDIEVAQNLLENDEIDENNGLTKRFYNRNNGNNDSEWLIETNLTAFVWFYVVSASIISCGKVEWKY